MKQLLKQLIEDNQKIHFEYNENDCDTIFSVIKSFPSASIVNENYGFYSYFTVKEYLLFIAKLTSNENFVERAINAMKLQDFLHIKIDQCSLSQRKRVIIAVEIIKNNDLFCLVEPLKGLDEDSIEIVLQWINNETKKIVTLSRSLREVYLCEGEKYSIIKDTIKTIYQDNDDEDIDEHDYMIQKIPVKFDEKIFLLNPEDIDYIEAQDGKTHVFVNREKFVSSLTMDELEQKLLQFGFYRCHRSYLVNMQRVTQIVKWTKNSYSLKLSSLDQEMVPLSKSKIQEMKDIYHF